MSAVVARRRAEQLLAELNVDGTPVDVVQIAQRLGVKVVELDLGENSGLLLRKDGKSTICVRHDDAHVRKRFTIAHEIGHFYLKHQDSGGGDVIVDRGFYISRRGVKASEGVDLIEIEANQFAATLLMPKRLISRAVAAYGSAPLLHSDVEDLASTFEVSEQAMTIRLSALGYL